MEHYQTGQTHSNSQQVLHRDAKAVQSILHSMGVYEYEPRVVPQLVDFMYRYVSEIVEEAQKQSNQKDSNEIDVEDVRNGINMCIFQNFIQPIPRDQISELAASRNSKPLKITETVGVKLSEESQQNLNLDTKKQKLEDPMQIEK